MGIDRNKPVWQMTAGELLDLFQTVQPVQSVQPETTNPDEKYVYGIAGLAKILGCSKTTANRVKQSGKIDKAIKQTGRKIVVDVEMAMRLLGKKN